MEPNSAKNVCRFNVTFLSLIKPNLQESLFKVVFKKCQYNTGSG